MNSYAVLAMLADFAHLVAMLVWGLGLPFLFWHRWPKLTIRYTWFVLGFVLASQLSHFVIGECFLTTISRALWLAAGDPTAGSFTVRLVNAVAGMRPTEESVVIAWEVGIGFTSLAMLWSMYRHRSRSRSIAGASSPST